MTHESLSRQQTLSRADDVLREADEHSRLDRREAAIFLLGAGAGLALGCLAGMLAAPMAGRITRRRIFDQANHYYHQALHGGSAVGRVARDYRHRAFGALVKAGKASGVLHEQVLGNQDLANKIRSRLGRMTGLDLANVLVDCAGGVCTLRGCVPDVSLIHAVERETAGVPGVQRVCNMLHSVPAG